MPTDNCIEITFPEDTSVSFPQGSSVNFPARPAMSISETVSVMFPAESGITFPAGNVIVVTVPGRPPFQIDPTAGTVTIPSGQPISISALSDIGLAISFPPQATISFPGQQQPMISFPSHIKVRVRRMADVRTPPRTDL
jgi:hypothetical protein